MSLDSTQALGSVVHYCPFEPAMERSLAAVQRQREVVKKLSCYGFVGDFLWASSLDRVGCRVEWLRLRSGWYWEFVYRLNALFAMWSTRSCL